MSKGSLRALPLYVGFAGTGVGVALPGVLLPVLLVRWHLRDEQGGTLLLLSWFGSSLANLLIRRSLRNSLAAGYLLTASGALGMAELSLQRCPWVLAIFGLGLGLTMTSTSLLRQRQAQVKGRELIRLNLMWALGACACPSLAIRILENGNTGPLLLGFGAFFLLLGLWAWTRADVHLDGGNHKAGSFQWRDWAVLRAIPFPLLAMVFLVTGVEASMGGWLTTYANRANHLLALTIAAPTCLWAGLLLSRMVWSLPTMKLSGWRVLQGSLGLVVASAILLVVSGGGGVVLMAAFGVGFGLGPVYPLLVAEALTYGESGALFLIAGLGSSALPWLTGALSERRLSLREGLLVPATGALLMLALGIVQQSRHRLSNEKTP